MKATFKNTEKKKKKKGLSNRLSLVALNRLFVQWNTRRYYINVKMSKLNYMVITGCPP